MQEISIVKRRSRLWPVLLVLILLAVLVLGALWFMGDRAPAEFGFSQLIELQRATPAGSA